MGKKRRFSIRGSRSASHRDTMIFAVNPVNQGFADNYYGLASGVHNGAPSPSAWAATATLITSAGTFSNIFVQTRNASGSTINTWTVYVNGVASGLQVQVPIGANSGSRTGFAIAVAAGDEVSVYAEATNDTSTWSLSLQFDPT